MKKKENICNLCKIQIIQIHVDVKEYEKDINSIQFNKAELKSDVKSTLNAARTYIHIINMHPYNVNICTVFIIKGKKIRYIDEMNE